ncbi:MAG TPA: type VI secretion system-associated FHA domain protein TagH [Steroidobacter sp.]|uniref:type VI secretion system-associated FHA domain protein TagH n=1 Tax=Steroidobacter sp. TaxID=1978227 RepID=UPI002EDAA513
MYLTLEVISANAAALGAGRRQVFSVDGGRIGRAPENQMVLPGAGVHRHHATVRFINGVFFIEGVGTNGIAVNNPDIVLPRHEPYPLKSGDKVFIDEFELVASASATPPVEPTAPTDAPLTAQTGRHATRAAAPTIPLVDMPGEAEDLDPLKQLLLGGAAPTPPAPRVPEQPWNHSPALSDHFAPSPIAPFGAPSPAQAIPEDWDKTSFNRSKLQPASPVPPPASVTASARPTAPPPSPARPAPMPPHAPVGEADAGTFDWNAFLRAAGVDPATVPSDTSAVLGNIMRTVVQGLIEVLRARSEIKTEFRMPVTQVKVSENNPLKFAANAEDALANLFGRRNPAYLPPQEAFEDAFSDVRFHQLAMLVGVRAGFDHLMSRFDPEQLEEVFSRQGRRSLFGGTKNWEMYSERYREMVKDGDETFRRLFGEEFARAYEQQLSVLKRGRTTR